MKKKLLRKRRLVAKKEGSLREKSFPRPVELWCLGISLANTPPHSDHEIAFNHTNRSSLERLADKSYGSELVSVGTMRQLAK